MQTISALEIKKRGISVVDEWIGSEPVHVIKNNRPQYVVLSEDRYREMMVEMNEAWELRIKASLEEAESGQVKRGDADQLMREIFSEE